jgi:hypothetical protein
MRKFLASAVLLAALSVPAFAGWIDQTGRACTPGGTIECTWVDGPSANLDTGSGTDEGVDFLEVGLTILFSIF